MSSNARSMRGRPTCRCSSTGATAGASANCMMHWRSEYGLPSEDAVAAVQHRLRRVPVSLVMCAASHCALHGLQHVI